MTESNQPPSAETLLDLLDRGDHEKAATALERAANADPDDRKETLQRLRELVDDRPGLLEPLLPTLADFLTDDERAVRLTAAKLFVAVAEADPDAALQSVDPLAARLADDEEFYYVRARSAEALGYVALEHSEAVATPELLADLRIGLSFDEPEVKRKLAKALEHVALGDPDRLRHQVSSLADHLDDDGELVRYHLCTALVAVGCENPAALADAADPLAARLTDECPQVRGRAAEALGLLARADSADVPVTEADLREADADEAFVDERIRFALDAPGNSPSGRTEPEPVGTVEGVRATTDDAVEAITTPDDDHECPHCGTLLPEHGVPMCPQCGAPR